MITLDDCRAFCDVDAATVARVARHERLPEILAIACAQSRVSRARRLRGANPLAAVRESAAPRRMAA